MKKTATILSILMLFCSGCSNEDATLFTIVALIPVAAVRNTIDSFSEPVCPDGERGVVIKVLDSSKRPIKGADIHFRRNSYDFVQGTDSQGVAFIRSFVDILEISISKEGFHELKLHKPVTLVELPAECKRRNKKTFLKEHQPTIVQLTKLTTIINETSNQTAAQFWEE